MFTFYKRIISPIITTLFGGGCRFTPTCSVYAQNAVQKYGWFKGTTKAIWRIIRCNPLYSGNLNDPVQ